MEFDGTFIVVIISFIGFMLLMRSIYFEPIRQIKAERETKKATDKQNASDYLKELEALQASYEQGLQDARKKAQQQIQQLRQNAKQSAAEKISAAKADAQKALDQKLIELAKWQEETYDTLKSERQALTQIVIGKVAGKIPVSSQ